MEKEWAGVWSTDGDGGQMYEQRRNIAVWNVCREGGKGCGHPQCSVKLMGAEEETP